jgi:hypothetical protein
MVPDTVNGQNASWPMTNPLKVQDPITKWWSITSQKTKILNYSLHCNIQTGSGAHSAYYSVGSGESFLGVTAVEWSWPLSSIWWQGQERVELYSTLSYIFMAWTETTVPLTLPSFVTISHNRVGGVQCVGGTDCLHSSPKQQCTQQLTSCKALTYLPSCCSHCRTGT